MIAFLCTSIREGRARILHQPLTAGLWLRSDNTLWTGVDGTGAQVGFLASTREHLIGKEISGYALLDNVSADLAAYAPPRLRQTMIGSRWAARNT